ncbi:MAG TPA: alpha-L-fucosidase [Verrucomicrobiota bacterium]|nr:alpha-L-fucosidase [Verrucomicrobiota bacterium]
MMRHGLFIALVASQIGCGGLAARGVEDTNTVYLFSTFREPEQDGLRFAYSFDGYHWSNVPGLFLKARVGGGILRDPSVCRGPDGTWHLVWTTAWRGDKGFGYAHSKDLVHWSEQRFIEVMAHEPETVNTWAPELFYDEASGRFFICWASTIPGRFADGLETPTNNHRMYFTTTADFQTFTPSRLFLDPGFSVIDCQILKAGPRYVLLLKDNTRPERNIKVAFGDAPSGPWREVSAGLTEHLTEGPSGLRIGEDWLIYYEAYQQKRYGVMKTRDFKTFEDVTSQAVFPPGLKHGTAFQATRKDLDYLFKVGTQQVWNVRLPWASPVPAKRVRARLAEIESVARAGPFQPDWASITNAFRTPSWYRDAKFGIFIHWGVYSVPAFGSEWYPRNMYTPGTPEFEHHRATHGPQNVFGYKDFIPRFTARSFDARAWAKLFKEAGARYVVPVAEHHDGFAMYDSQVTEWSAVKRGPRRDVLAEQTRAYRRAGLVPGASSHRAEHWFFFDQGLYWDSDVRDTNHASLYGPAGNKRTAEAQAEIPDEPFLQDWLLRACEIVDQYRPQLFYFDWWICQPVFQPYLKTFAAYYYNRGVQWKQEVAINFKEWEGRSFPPGAGVFDIERGQAGQIRPDFWQTDTSVSKNSWGYIHQHQYKEPGEIVDDLVDVVSKNGTLLLNIGPRADGTIPEREQQMLRDIGRWLKINGDAIYGSRPWRVFGEGPTRIVEGSFGDVKRPPFTAQDIRFTTRGGRLYAIALAWPPDRQLLIRSLAAGGGPGLKLRGVRLLGHRGSIAWEQTPGGLRVALPEKPPCDFAIALEITAFEPFNPSPLVN